MEKTMTFTEDQLNAIIINAVKLASQTQPMHVRKKQADFIHRDAAPLTRLRFRNEISREDLAKTIGMKESSITASGSSKSKTTCERLAFGLILLGVNTSKVLDAYCEQTGTKMPKRSKV